MWSPRLPGVRCVCVCQCCMLHTTATIAPAVESRDHYNDVYVSGTIGECELVLL